MSAVRLKEVKSLGPVATPGHGQLFNVSYHKRTWKQKLIALFTRSEFTHSGLVGRYLREEGDWETWEADFKVGWKRGRLSHYKDKATLEFSSYSLSQKEVETILTAAKAYEGIGYSWGALLALLVSAIGLTPNFVMEKLKSPSTLICSEGVAKCYLVAGISIIPGLEVSRTTPADLSNALRGNSIHR